LGGRDFAMGERRGREPGARVWRRTREDHGKTRIYFLFSVRNAESPALLPPGFFFLPPPARLSRDAVSAVGLGGGRAIAAVDGGCFWMVRKRPGWLAG
jgi:hypothetical protein